MEYPRIMNFRLLFFALAAVIACAVFYFVGYRNGSKESPLQEDRQGEVIMTLGAYNAAKATNWMKVQSFLSVEILSLTRDYERRFGIPRSTNNFANRFAEAKAIADRVEAQMVPVSAIGTALGTNFKVHFDTREDSTK
jgi:hypothetical protein